MSVSVSSVCGVKCSVARGGRSVARLRGKVRAAVWMRQPYALSVLHMYCACTLTCEVYACIPKVWTDINIAYPLTTLHQAMVVNHVFVSCTKCLRTHV